MRFYRFSFSLKKQSNNWLKNRKNSEFVVSEMVVGFGEQDSRTQLWLLHSCYLEYVLAHYLISFANFVS